MRTCTLARELFAVSVVGCAVAPAISALRGVDHRDVVRALDRALALGISVVEVAADEDAERLVGESLRALRMRDKVVVTTHATWRDLQLLVERTLRATRLDALPLVQLPMTAAMLRTREWPEMVGLCARLVHEGKVIAWAAAPDASFADAVGEPVVEPVAAPVEVFTTSSGGSGLLLPMAGMAEGMSIDAIVAASGLSMPGMSGFSSGSGASEAEKYAEKMKAREAVRKAMGSSSGTADAIAEMEAAAAAARTARSSSDSASASASSSGSASGSASASASASGTASAPAIASVFGAPFAAIAVPFSLCNRAALPIIQLARGARLGVLALQPLAGGALGGELGPGSKLAFADDRRGLDLEAIAERVAHLATLVELRPPAASTKIRATRVEQPAARSVASLALRWAIDATNGGCVVPRLRPEYVDEAVGIASAGPLATEHDVLAMADRRD